MLRKDVKLGFAIGGIMLAVVIVYVLVVPGDRKNVSVITDDSTNKTDIPAFPPSADAKTDNKSSEPDITSPANAPPAEPAKAETDQPTTSPSANPPAGTSAGNTGGNTGGNGAADWNKLLTQGSSSPTMMSETPTPGGNQGADRGTDHSASQSDAAATGTPANSATNSPESSTLAASATPTPEQVAAAAAAAADTSAGATASEKSTPDLAIDTSGTAATQPAETAQRTHVVQPGEMLTSIAAAAYGNSKDWKKIAAANPNVNPNRMTPGTKLVLPVLASFSQPGSNNTSSISSTATLDPQTQYQVEPNDSLYRISMKLYGKPDHVDKLYQANKETIGSDPRRLKQNMVLKLTDPPTTSTTASR